MGHRPKRLDGSYAVMIAGPGVPPGGGPGQVLTKTSDRDYDTFWHTIAMSDVQGLEAALDVLVSEADLAGYAKLAGGNAFTGDQSIVGNLVVTGQFVELGSDAVPGVQSEITLLTGTNHLTKWYDVGGNVASLYVTNARMQWNAPKHEWRGVGGGDIFGSIDINGLSVGGKVTLEGEAYGPAWAAKSEAPTKQALYAKIETLGAGGGGITDGDKGDVVVSGGGTALTVESAAGNFAVTGNVTLGNHAVTPTATPTKLDMGASYSQTPGLNPKLTIFDDGSERYGFGVSSAQLDYIAGVGASHTFWIGNVKVATLTSTALTVNGNIAATGTITVPDDPYAPSWDGNLTVPTKNAVYDKIQALAAGGGSLTDGDYGDVLVSGSGAVMTVQTVGGANIATTAQLANYLPLTGGTITGLVTHNNSYIKMTGTNAFPGAAAASAFINYDPANGLILYGAGTATDFYLGNKAGSAVMQVPTGTQNAVFSGSIIGKGHATTKVGVDRLQLLESGGNTNYGMRLGYYNTGVWGGAIDVVQLGGPAPLSLQPSGGLVECLGSLTVAGNIAAAGTITSGGSTLATVSQLANYLPLTGGTLTGPLLLNTGASVGGSIEGNAGTVIQKASTHSWASAAGVTQMYLTPGNPRLTINGGANTAPQLWLTGQNPELHLDGDANSYYPTISVSGIGGSFSISSYNGFNASCNASYTFASTIAGAQASFTANGFAYLTASASGLSAKGGAHYFGPGQGDAIGDSILYVRTTNYYPQIIFQTANGGAVGTALLECGRFFIGLNGINHFFDVHNFGNKAQTVSYASIGAAGLSLPQTTGTVISIGASTSTPSATPASINLGGTYSNAAGANAKLKIFDIGGANFYGFGVSAGSLDYMCPTGAVHNFYVNAVKAGSIGPSGIDLPSGSTYRINGVPIGGAGSDTQQVLASASSVVIAVTDSLVSITALAVPVTITAPASGAVDGKRCILRIKDNGTARAINLSTGLRACLGTSTGVAGTTVAGKWIYYDLVFNATAGLWDIIRETKEF